VTKPDWQVRAEEYRAKDKADTEHLMKSVSEWEPAYGFCATNEHDRVALAMTLEALRRRVCSYGGGNRCDCKYGLRVDRGAVVHEFGITPPEGTPTDRARSMRYSGTKGNSEQTGCPELREIIHRLLHRDQPLI